MVLHGKVAVVTGSGQGIGRAIALAMAAEGAKVVTNSRTPGSKGGDAASTAGEIKKNGGEAVAVFSDVAKFDAAERIINTAVSEFSKIDILVNNAGVDAPKMVWNMSEQEWDLCLGASLKGAFNCTRFACSHMKSQKWGRIINCTSEAWLGTVGHVNYGAAKAGIVGLTRAVAREMGRYNVTCNAFAPLASTRMTSNDAIKEAIEKRFKAGLISKERYEEVLDMPDAEGVSPMILYLASEDAADINGQVFHVEAGKIGFYSESTECRVIYKNFRKEGYFQQAEFQKYIPKMLQGVYTNPAPPEKKE